MWTSLYMDMSFQISLISSRSTAARSHGKTWTRLVMNCHAVFKRGCSPFAVPEAVKQRSCSPLPFPTTDVIMFGFNVSHPCVGSCAVAICIPLMTVMSKVFHILFCICASSIVSVCSDHKVRVEKDSVVHIVTAQRWRTQYELTFKVGQTWTVT